ncbi:hypothetical protein E2C01_039803 [Portunus trituberculatus]|uniref:Uncharacterized protein n=1 Tax=Portunus trituberculatus TaxID=210409 RepID=A0A5B7FP02_PORTR|nr:hypothetical protein [Portunus trituberculatus]
MYVYLALAGAHLNYVVQFCSLYHRKDVNLISLKWGIAKAEAMSVRVVSGANHKPLNPAPRNSGHEYDLFTPVTLVPSRSASLYPSHQ